MTSVDDQIHTRDGLALCVRRWMPVGDVRAVLVFVHGFTEHSGRYEELAEALVDRGFAVWAMDLRGHGRSEGCPIYCHDFYDYLDDLELLLDRVRKEHARQPLFLMGHSMGAAVVLLAALREEMRASGVVASAPPVRIGGSVFPLLRHLAWSASRVFPRLRPLAIGCSMLSRDPAVVEDFRNDPLVYHGRLPVRTGAEILRAGRLIRRRAVALELPLLVLHGTDDVITNAPASRQFFDNVVARDKTLKIYDGLYHDLFHEPEKEQVTADLIVWLEARVGG